MLGFFFGTVCLLGLVGMAKRAIHGGGGCHRHCGARGGWGGCGARRGRPGRRGDGFARAAGEVFKRRLRIDEEQEPIVDHALIDLRKSLKELMEELEGSRAAISGAFVAEVIDDAALASAFARHDDAIARARREVVSAMKQVHAVLDADQRKHAAEWLGSTDGGWV
ncbi:MAG: periplasmic heavy metal sensor [Pseudomonadota bacterium]|nr:periplasmic heavy metal sensor [Pseudomonadota bacterium]